MKCLACEYLVNGICNNHDCASRLTERASDVGLSSQQTIYQRENRICKKRITKYNARHTLY
jgi:hypothetical protein